jgi:hypothetical protein
MVRKGSLWKIINLLPECPPRLPLLLSARIIIKQEMLFAITLLFVLAAALKIFQTS